MVSIFLYYYLKERVLFLSRLYTISFLRRSLYMKLMKDELLNMPRRRNVEEVQGEPESRLLLLRRDGPALTRSENGIISGLSNDALSLIQEKGGELKTHSLKVFYSYILTTSSLFTFIIIHLNISFRYYLSLSTSLHTYLCVFMACFPTVTFSILLD